MTKIHIRPVIGHDGRDYFHVVGGDEGVLCESAERASELLTDQYDTSSANPSRDRVDASPPLATPPGPGHGSLDKFPWE